MVKRGADTNTHCRGNTSVLQGSSLPREDRKRSAGEDAGGGGGGGKGTALGRRQQQQQQQQRHWGGANLRSGPKQHTVSHALSGELGFSPADAGAEATPPLNAQGWMRRKHTGEGLGAVRGSNQVFRPERLHAPGAALSLSRADQVLARAFRRTEARASGQVHANTGSYGGRAEPRADASSCSRPNATIHM